MTVEVCSSGWQNHTITAALIVWRSRVSGALALTEPRPPRGRTFENQSFRASGLSLITAAIVHWNTVYLDRAVRQLRAQGATVPDDLLAHVAPLGWEHIALTGDYVWTEANPAAPFRPLRETPATFPPLAA
jgi:Tn3 transposase DDE domain